MHWFLAGIVVSNLAGHCFFFPIQSSNAVDVTSSLDQLVTVGTNQFKVSFKRVDIGAVPVDLKKGVGGARLK